MNTDDDRDDEDYGNPNATECDLYCECGRAYRGLAVPHDRSYDSPGWYEPEPGEEKCPTCCTADTIERDIIARVREFIA